MKGHNFGGRCKKCGKSHVHPKGMLGKHPSPETREKMRVRMTGNKNPMYGVRMKGISWNTGLTKITDERLARIGAKVSEALTGRKSLKKGKTYEELYGPERAREIKRKMHSERHRENISIGQKEAWENKEIRNRRIAGIINAWKGEKKEQRLKKLRSGGTWGIRTPEAIEKIRKMMKAQWRCRDFREKVVKNILAKLRERPTSYEQKLIDLIEKNRLPFKYVGDGSLIIAGKNPDFVESNGRKILIEVYEEYWKSPDYEEKRGELFAKIGFKTIFIDGKDLSREDWEQHCLNKIEGVKNGG